MSEEIEITGPTPITVLWDAENQVVAGIKFDQKLIRNLPMAATILKLAAKEAVGLHEQNRQAAMLRAAQEARAAEQIRRTIMK